MVGIYKITSPTGRIYIGQSTNIPSRWNDYYKLRASSIDNILSGRAKQTQKEKLKFTYYKH